MAETTESAGKGNGFQIQTATPEGELALLHEANAGSEIGCAWMEGVRAGLQGAAAQRELSARPLVKKLADMAGTMLVPRPDNFTPPSRTPWGGTLITDEIKSGLPLAERPPSVGESWELSGHPSFPNRFELRYAGCATGVSILVLEKLFPERLFGAGGGTAMPFLVKLLNSGAWSPFGPRLRACLSALDAESGAEAWRKAAGAPGSLPELLSRDHDGLHRGLSALEAVLPAHSPQGQNLHRLHQEMLAKNLSVQVHPPADYTGLKPGEHSKAEGWIVVRAEEGAGIYLGLREGVTEQSFRRALQEGQDVTALLNFISVRPGDAFFIPPGTMHAIGAGVLLVEPQETSETTFRVYDYGRVDAEGRPRALHVDAAMAVTRWDGPRGDEAVETFRRRTVPVAQEEAGAARVERFIRESVFETIRLTFRAGDRYRNGRGGGIKGGIVLEGSVKARAHAGDWQTVEISRGQSFLAPASLQDFTLTADSERAVVLLTTASC